MARGRLVIKAEETWLSEWRPIFRWVGVSALVAVMIVAGVRWRLINQSSALEFTTHTIGSLPGVQDVKLFDIDRDDDLDIVAVGLSGVKIFQNAGNFTFSENTIDDKEAERVQAVDLSGDGVEDLLVTYKGSSPAIRWFKKVDNSDLEFTTNEISGTGSDPIAYANDLDNDGDNDLVTVGSDGGTQTLRRWTNDGTGGFSATTIQASSGVKALAIADLIEDGDSFPDIVTGGDQGLERWSTTDGSNYTEVDIDENNGNQTHLDIEAFEGRRFVASADSVTDEVALYVTSGLGRHTLEDAKDAKTVDLIDIDQDGDLDVLIAAQDDNEILLYTNDGTEQFSRSTIASDIQSVYGVTAGDLDGDGDPDVVAGNHVNGDVFAYERLQARPIATKPDDISQSTDGAGIITFSTTVSDVDRDQTKLRIQYSPDGGNRWYKPDLKTVTVDVGETQVDIDDIFQVGSVDEVDTDEADDVKVTLTWDTKSAKNTGGPIVGDVGDVQLRVIPRDPVGNGAVATSNKFRVDNQGPSGLSDLTIDSISETEATLSWQAATDSNTFVHELFYGTDHAAVLERRSEVWDGDDDEAMNDIESTTATIDKALVANTQHTFKLFVKDKFGNLSAAPSVRGVTSAASLEPTPSPSPSPSSDPGLGLFPSPSPTPSPSTDPSPLPGGSSPEPSPEPSLLPSPEVTNQTPIADAGPDKVVNPGALVILDASASSDPDPGETSQLRFTWRQLSGEQLELFSARTDTASFTAGEEGETYILGLTVSDVSGAVAIDSVTVAVRTLPRAPSEPVTIVDDPVDDSDQGSVESQLENSQLVAILSIIDIGLFTLSIGLIGLLTISKLFKLGGGKREQGVVGVRQANGQGVLVHYRTGDPIANAQILIYGADGKLRLREKTNNRGVFGTFFPKGEYTLGVQAEGFTFAASAPKSLAPPGSILYSGGKLKIANDNQALSLVVPMKPKAEQLAGAKISFLTIWQNVQHWARLASWPTVVSGVLLNTLLVFFTPNLIFLSLELLYVILVLMKIVLDVRTRPAYGLVRDALTRIPLSLAVVRLYDQKTNRLIMTSVTNGQGKFFALPPAGTYRVSVSKPGYAAFEQDNVELASGQDTTVQMTAELMPVTAGNLAARPV